MLQLLLAYFCQNIVHYEAIGREIRVLFEEFFRSKPVSVSSGAVLALNTRK